MEHRPESSSDAMPIVPLMIFFGAVVLILAALLASQPAARQGQAVANAPTTAPEAAEVTPEATVEATAQVAAPAGEIVWNLDPQAVMAGEGVFHTVCMACHGFNGEGIQGLGKPLVGSEFVNGLSDDELAQFIIVGREATHPLNTTGVAMPARGGNPGLSDQNIHDTVAFIRSMNVAAGFEPVAGGTVSAAAAADATAAPTTVAVASTPVVPEVIGGIAPEIGIGELSLSAMDGETAYVWACANCHGLDGNPVAPLASQPLAGSALVQAQDDAGLLSFLASAQPPVNPLEAFPHPYRGGYPELTDEQLQAVIGYLYTLPGAQ